MPATKWGLASSGKICFDFANALTTLKDGNHEIVAVAARSAASAKEFAAKFDIPKALEGYAALAADSDVEVVYVGTIHPTHLQVVKMMLEGGKHVLCEKPLAMNVRETTEMIQLAKDKGLFLMEAMWTSFLPPHEKV